MFYRAPCTILLVLCILVRVCGSFDVYQHVTCMFTYACIHINFLTQALSYTSVRIMITTDVNGCVPNQMVRVFKMKKNVHDLTDKGMSEMEIL